MHSSMVGSGPDAAVGVAVAAAMVRSYRTLEIIMVRIGTNADLNK